MNYHAVLAWGLSQQEPIILKISKQIRSAFHKLLAKKLQKVVHHSFAVMYIADLNVYKSHHPKVPTPGSRGFFRTLAHTHLQ